jgi:hypothetical protein
MCYQVESFNDKRAKYQCAYRLWQLRLFENWDESAWDGGSGQYKGDLTDNDIVYLQDSYVVNR